MCTLFPFYHSLYALYHSNRIKSQSNSSVFSFIPSLFAFACKRRKEDAFNTLPAEWNRALSEQ